MSGGAVNERRTPAVSSSAEGEESSPARAVRRGVGPPLRPHQLRNEPPREATVTRSREKRLLAMFRAGNRHGSACASLRFTKAVAQ